MDKSAIQAIRDMAVTDRINAFLNAGGETLAQYAVALPENYKLVNLEKYGQVPVRFRGTFNTTNLFQFINYVNDNGVDSTGLFVDPEKGTASAIIDMGNNEAPEWGEHQAHLKLKKSPEFAKLIEHNGGALSQQGFIDFAEDWQDNIGFITESGDAIDFKAAIAALRRLTVSATQNNETAVGNFNASHSSLDAIEVKAVGSVLPYGFVFTCHPYEAFDLQLITCQLRALTDGKTVTIKFRMIGRDKLVDLIGQEFRALLHRGINLDVKLYEGTMNYGLSGS